MAASTLWHQSHSTEPDCGMRTLRQPPTARCSYYWRPPGATRLLRFHVTHTGTEEDPMRLSVDQSLCEGLHKLAHPLTGDREDFDPLLALVGDSRFVLIGEASHGTHEFYRI